METEDLGLAVRVIVDGTWGFAAGADLDPETAAQACRGGGRGRPGLPSAVSTEPIELAPEPVHDDVTGCPSYDVNPFEVPTAEKVALLIDWSRPAARHGRRRPRQSPTWTQVQENKFYADLAGTITTQQRVRLRRRARGRARVGATDASTRCARSGPRSAAAGSTSPRRRHGWDFEASIAELPALLAEKLKAPLEAGRALRPGHRPDRTCG